MAKFTADQIDALVNETATIVKGRRRRPVKAIRARAAKVEQAAAPSEETSQPSTPVVVTTDEKEAAMPETTPTPAPAPAPQETAESPVGATIPESETQAAETQTAAPQPEKAPDEKPADEKPTPLNTNPTVIIKPEFAGYLAKAVSSSWKTIGADALKIFSNSKRVALRSTAVETLVDKTASDLARKCAVPGALRALCKALPLERTLLLTPGISELVVKLPTVVVSFQYTNSDDGPSLSVSWCGDGTTVAALSQYTRGDFIVDGLSPDAFAAVLGCVIELHDNHILKTLVAAEKAK